jgi:hypothetical protein
MAELYAELSPRSDIGDRIAVPSVVPTAVWAVSRNTRTLPPPLREYQAKIIRDLDWLTAGGVAVTAPDGADLVERQDGGRGHDREGAASSPPRSS